MTESYEKDDYMSDLVNFNSPASHHYLHHLNHGQHGNVNQYSSGGGGGSSNSSNITSINGHATVDGDIPAEEDEMMLWRARRLVARFLQAHTGTGCATWCDKILIAEFMMITFSEN